MKLAEAFWYAAWAGALLGCGVGSKGCAWLVVALGILAGLAAGVGSRAGPSRVTGASWVARASRRGLAAAAGGAACMWLRLCLAPVGEGSPPPASWTSAGEAPWDATVLESPEPRGEGWECLAEARRARAGAARIAALDSVAAPGADISRRVSVRLVRGAIAGIAPGARLRLYGEFERPTGPRNPGELNFRTVLGARGACGTVRVRNESGLEIAHSAPWLPATLEDLRGRVRACLARRVPGPGLAYAAALGLGEATGLRGEDRDGLVALGVIHIVIIAGLHLHMVRSGVAGALRFAAMPAVVTRLGALAAVGAYAWLGHFHVPAQRVAISLGLAECSAGLGRAHDARATAAMAGAALLLLQPAHAVGTAFVLSALATWGLHRLAPESAAKGAWRPLQQLASASIFTQLAVWPVLPWTAGRGAWVGAACNFVAVPLATAMIAGIALGGMLELLGLGAWPGAWLGPQLLGGVLHRLSHAGWLWGGSGVPLSGTPVAWAVAGLAGLALYAHGRGAARVAGGVAYAAAALLIAAGPLVRPARAASLRAAFLDVGQGDACVLTFPSGESVLVDAGMAKADWDAGSSIVEPAMRALGVRSLAWATASHSDADHAGGLAHIARRGLAAGWILPDARARGRWQVLSQAIRTNGAPVEQVHAGWAWTDSMGADTVRVLFPDESALRAGLRENDLSVVMEVSTPEGNALLAGDLEQLGEARLCSLGSLRPVALLKVGHHGSRTSSTPAFLGALGRPAAVVSVGKRNPFGHPSPEVIQRLRATCGPVWLTSEEGAVLLEFTSEGVCRVTADAWNISHSQGGATPPRP